MVYGSRQQLQENLVGDFDQLWFFSSKLVVGGCGWLCTFQTGEIDCEFMNKTNMIA
jgi:hypothetical protein